MRNITAVSIITVSKKALRISFYIFCVIALLNSCRKDEEISTDPAITLSFSTDTVWFDTVFVKSGDNQPASVTKRLWVRNTSDNAVKVNISLKGNPWGIYKLNIDGQPTNIVSGKVIRGKDSIIIFVQMYVNQSNTSQPFIVTDEIDFNTNGNLQHVDIAGYARAARYLRNEVLDCATNNLHWTADTPYVIYDSILVPKGCVLTIDAGTHIYSHVKSCFLVSGTLIVNGTTSNPVIFEGDRLELDFTDIPGQWIGIRFLTNSKDNVVKNAIIKNGFVGVQVDSSSINSNPKLVITESVISNMSAFGLCGFTADILAINNLVNNCGQYTFIGALGGNYNLYHNTFVTYSKTFSRTNRTVLLDNSPLTDLTGNIIAAFPLNADLRNNIIYGSQDDELYLNTNADGGNKSGSISIVNCLIHTKEYATLFSSGANVIVNQDPEFNDTNKDDFDLKNSSPAKGKGMYVNVSSDLKGRSRNMTSPSMGCYE